MDLDRIIENMQAYRHKSVDGDEISSEEGVHCPHCGYFTTDLSDTDVYGDGEHDFWCVGCGEDFEVSTSVTYRWTSRKTRTA